MKTDASGFPEYVRRPGIPNPVIILSEKRGWMKAEFEAQLQEEARLNQEIAENLAKVNIRG